MDILRRHLIASLGLCTVLAAALPAAATTCGDNPGDAAAVASVRAQIDSQCDCSPAAASHLKYVRCAAGVVNAAKTGGSLPSYCGNAVMKCARQSAIGRPGAVACCRTSAAGVTRASIKRSAAACQAPSGGHACVAYALSVCDACMTNGCVIPPTPTPSPTPTPTPVLCPQPVIPLPNLIQVPLTLQNGTSNCGGPAFNPPALPPFSGQVDDPNAVKLADLGLGCLYAGGTPPLSVPGGSTAMMNVVGVTTTQLVLGPSAGNGPTSCTLGAGPNSHCINGAKGTDGHGACASDAECKGVAGACALDANCFFGPPIPTAVGPLGACVVNALQTDICGTADLSGNTSLAATISARVYTSSNVTTPCPQCVNGTCNSGPSMGLACTAAGAGGTAAECPPVPSQFFATLTVPLAPLTTGTSTLTQSGGHFCPVPPGPTPAQQPVCPQPTPPGSNAFGVTGAQTIQEVGTGLLSTNLLHVNVGATFCIPPTGGIADTLVGLPQPGAISVTGQIDLTNALPIVGPLLGLLP